MPLPFKHRHVRTPATSEVLMVGLSISFVPIPHVFPHSLSSFL
ncbi:unnamed protein product [Taenia asiatica]|uniref:Uncharacterized protein n=1 Tax=Taenia asiatica TaxID=60517 RepID=A0A0R3W9C0_TAEAS|nr:unnamed protein product [Taenia asiatica]